MTNVGTHAADLRRVVRPRIVSTAAGNCKTMHRRRRSTTSTQFSKFRFRPKKLREAQANRCQARTVACASRYQIAQFQNENCLSLVHKRSCKPSSIAGKPWDMNEPMQERIHDPAQPGFLASSMNGSVSTRRDAPSAGQSTTASIIVWDASPLSLLTLAGVMDSQGYRCICARDSKSALKTLDMGRQDLLVCDVGDDAAGALETIEKLRSVEGYEQLPAVLIAESRWAGLEKKAEAAFQPTRCLFKPIDPNALIAVVDQLLWMPKLVDTHRRRGSRPSRPGWVSL